MLATALIDAGHAVRGSSRSLAGSAAIEAAGAEAVIVDPDRLATLGPALEHVAVACVLLGSAAGDPRALAALHGPRLEALLGRTLDTTVRGIVYEAAGSVAAEVLAGGAEIVGSVCSRSSIPHALLAADPAAGHEAWLAQALAAVALVLERG